MVRNGINCLKYITVMSAPVRDKFSGYFGKQLETIHIFSGNVSHADMISSLRVDTGDILGAGFVSIIEAGKFHCWGNSETLGIGSRGIEDTNLANELMFGYRD